MEGRSREAWRGLVLLSRGGSLVTWLPREPCRDIWAWLCPDLSLFRWELSHHLCTKHGAGKFARSLFPIGAVETQPRAREWLCP